MIKLRLHQRHDEFVLLELAVNMPIHKKELKSEERV
jgi:hypothetical protein